ncbi:Calcium-transporting ATPase 2 [Escovopsis weberi]|uniref:Calcium-transporting ATPase 2 n=1 Tax=Escovopsis weberi TaxID=150374 RepID=A0A0M8N9A9_ESCWE|nr:Calcium-transporting ATPase 2 [Escovopsis weberi]
MDGIASSSSPPPRQAEPVAIDRNFHQVRHNREAIAVLRAAVRGEAPIPSNCFAFTPSQLHRLLTERSLAALAVFGGLDGLALGLRTHLAHGLSVDETTLEGTITFDEALAAARDGRLPKIHPVDPLPTRPTLTFQTGDASGVQFAHRRRIFGANSLPRLRQKSFFQLMWIAFNDKLIILLAISACISLAIGIYQSVVDKALSKIEWVDGLTVVAAIVVIVLASAATDWQKNYRFKKLVERNQQRNVTVLRSGRVQQVSVCDIMVGDVVHIEAGEVVVADGVLVQSSSLYIDESSITGESELLLKSAPDRAHPLLGNADPFILSGTTVRRGIGRYLITSIGANSIDGKNLMSLGEGVDITPLQERLGRLGKQLITFGAVAGLVYFIVLFIRFLVRLPQHHVGPTDKAEAFLRIVMLAIAIVVITVPEGLALNVTIALAFATKKMLKDNNLVRLIRSVEVMGSATCICSDKTGTLTQNKMAVVAGRIGLSRDSGFDDGQVSFTTGSSDPSTISYEPKYPTSRHFMPTLSFEIRALIKDSVALNSTAFERDISADSEFFGSSTETALLHFSREHLGMGALCQERAGSAVVAMLPFDSSRKWMAVLIKLADGKYRLLVKGAAEIIFEYCAYVIADPTYRFTTSHLEEDDRASFSAAIQDYANNLLRPVAIAFRDFEEHEVMERFEQDGEGDEGEGEGEGEGEREGEREPSIVNLEWLASGMVFIGFFGLRDPLRPEVVESVRKCQEAGVFVRMVTGDNFLTAKAVASECGIYTPGGVAMDGPTFRKLTQEQREAIVPRLQVLARSSPEDKVLLVTCLRDMKETVAVTGDGTNDAFALKAADVGFAMGLQGTEVAKVAASIILLDDNFASIVKALAWGRTVIDAVKKFCQFQFTINITAGILAAVSELVGDSIFTVVQLLWINLIMDIFASMAFATDHPSPEFLKRKPEPRNAPLVTTTMWKMIIGQAIYQCLVVFLVHYIGLDLLKPDPAGDGDKLQSLVFNIYVWMQFFNQHNCRRVDNKVDIYYQGVLTNHWFLSVQAITIVGQFVIMFKGGEAFDTKPLSGSQWGWSMLFGIISIPLGAIIRQIPDRYVTKAFHTLAELYRSVTHPLRSRFPLRGTGAPGRASNSQTAAAPDNLEVHVGGGSLNPMKLHSWNSSFGPSFRSTQASLGKQAAASSLAETALGQEAEIDLHKLIDAAKQGSLPQNEIIEIHPRTLQNDPILTQRSDANTPPSQDAAIQRYVFSEKKRNTRSTPRRMSLRRTPASVPAAAAGITRPQRARTRSTVSQGWLTWEGLLRSKRR